MTIETELPAVKVKAQITDMQEGTKRMKETWPQRTAREISETLTTIRTQVANGMSPTDAINRSAHTAETYAAALREYNLKPVIPD